MAQFPDSTQRFSERVNYYIKYRPTYPTAIIDFFQQIINLAPPATVADIGSGTGLLSELFLQPGYRVYGVEPNLEMRQAGENLLGHYPNFVSIPGSAEETTLGTATIDLIVAGQAFHWFNVAACRLEFQRILRPGGWVGLIWNERQTDTTAFLQAYEQFLKDYSTDYVEVNHKNIDQAVLQAFFGGPQYQVTDFANAQIFDWDGLLGRTLSSSYIPMAGHPNYEPMLEALENLFQTHQEQGQVTFSYDTRVYYGQLQ